MKSLPINFKRDGMDCRVLSRTEFTALIELSKPGWKAKAYEVIKISKNKAWSRFGKDFPESESLPSSNTWGKNGWSYNNIKDATKKYKLLNE
jgi:hypothetical protein